MMEVPNSEQRIEEKASKGRFITNPSHSSRLRQPCQQRVPHISVGSLETRVCYHCPHEKLAVPAAEAPWSPVALQGCAVAGSCALELVLTGRIGNRSPAVLAQRPLLGARGRQLGAQGWGHGLQEQTLHQHSLTPSVHCTANTMPALLLSHPLPTRRLHFFPSFNTKNRKKYSPVYISPHKLRHTYNCIFIFLYTHRIYSKCYHRP